MPSLLARIRELVGTGRFRVSAHGFEELASDDISLAELVAGIPSAVSVEEYPDADYRLSARSGSMDRRFLEEEAEMNRKAVRFVHAGRYAAEVDVELIPDDDAWGPYLSSADALKLDRSRSALKRGDVAAASREAPLSA